MKSYGVTIQMKPLQQYFCMVPFVFQYFTKRNLGFFLNFDSWHSWQLKGWRSCHGDCDVFGSQLPQIKTKYLCHTRNVYRTLRDRYCRIFKEVVNHGVNFSEFSKQKNAIHFHSGHLQSKILIFTLRAPTCSQAFSRALCRFHVFVSSSDWLAGLSVLIG